MTLLKNLVLTTALFLFISSQLNAQLVINEISICNVSKQLDPNYDYSGWIEIYNSSSTEIDLRNVYFSDEEANPMKYRISQNRVIKAYEYGIVWLNDEIKNTTTGYTLDTDMDGGFLSIADKKGSIYDSMNYDPQFTNVSYGRAVNGDINSPLVYFLDETFSTSNEGARTGTEMVKTPKFSVASGFYNEAVNISITCATKGAEIYYTLDNSEPTTESSLYEGTIELTASSSIRARAFKDGLFDGLIATNTYMINERKPESLPVVFINTTEENLYDDMLGINCVGTNGVILAGSNPSANYNRDWTRWANFELIDENRELHINQPFGLAISGNASRGFDQKSFKIKGRERYGKKRFDYDLFPSRDGLRYKSFILRSGGQPYNSVQLIHDSFMQSLADVTPLDYQASTPTVVYLNGKYWGIYNLRERKNRDFVYSHYGYAETDIDMIEYAWRAIAGTGSKTRWDAFDSFVMNNDMSIQENYEKVVEQMDIENYLYYMSIQLLIKNNDWPNNNQQIFAPQNGKWKWILQDLDKGLENNRNTNVLKTLIDSSSKLLSTKLIVRLLDNENFKNDYITIQSLVAGSVSRPGRLIERINNMKETIASVYPYYQAKWPVQGSTDLEKGVTNVINNLNSAFTQIYDNTQINFELGKPYALNIGSTNEQTYIHFNNHRIPVLPYEGKWFEDREITLQAPLYEGDKKFKHWLVSTNGKTQHLLNTTITLTINEDTDVTAVYESADLIRRPGLYINEISAENRIYVDNKSKYEDWVEIYNSSQNDIDLAGYYISNDRSDLTRFQFTNNENNNSLIVPANGRVIVWCSTKTSRGDLHTNFELDGMGGEVILSHEVDTDIEIIDEVTFPTLTETSSFGRYPDGGIYLTTFYRPTFNLPNLNSIHDDMFSYIEEVPLVPTGIENNIANRNEPLIYKIDSSTIFIETKGFHNLTIVTVNGEIKEKISLNQENYLLNLNNYENGIYLIVLESSTNRYVHKFIK